MQPSLDISTPEELAQLLEGKTDADVIAVVSELGVDAVLDQVLQSMQRRFLPHKAGGARATIQWRVLTPVGVRPFSVEVAAGQCTIARGEAGAPRVTIEAQVPVFLRLLAGRLSGLEAFSRGALRVTGEQALALRQQLWFDVDLSHARLSVSTPSELARLIDGRQDDEIEAGIAVTGVRTALEQVFTGMVEHYRPHKGPRKRTVVEFSVRTSEGDRVYQLVADGVAARYHEGERERSNVTLLLSFPSFLRMAAGKLDGIVALAQGKVKVRGNILLARNIQSWFDLRA